ncbi:hydroxymethylglutaryl-CoA reductase, degradative [Fructilactobacillus florum]|uniref:3-hydroxy-3-methylglutaryl coenzyme A reductase n=1 Tax=Fructilactobacillus florum DSM 22689 = JCM 16035 TaxID=1423745 RepID=A0A0R2CQP1_9LACO|nr:hydroxymethylglutaryl-CoA reductase, degradative [Fructilactobacillus florum]EKK20131.1 Hydroxymethylglutaryl-CoA reductase [Fructilactobacillus florum 2F]KRM90051.1 3-hydroxy-3-methylglutaryl-CoA reductase [Fructilactobacillus florum DSM 22689 = JCM 16035]
MTELHGFHRKSYEERFRMLVAATDLSANEQQVLQANYQPTEAHLIENYLTSYGLPEGIVPNVVVNQKHYLVPMVTEEPSVIAAASNGAGMLRRGGGITATAESHVLTGEVLIKADNLLVLQNWFDEHRQLLLQTAVDAHPSIKKYGGVRDLKFNPIDETHASFELFVDVGNAMGANLVNSMLEAIAALVETELDHRVIMSILSNFGDHNIVMATGMVPFSALQRGALSGEEVAARIEEAAHIAKIYPKRAATHNKGIMNGIDAVVVATGNDWRAVESSAHSYAARKGSYQGLSKWEVTPTGLSGMIKLPIPTGIVGGATHVLPISKVNYHILQLDSALEMMNLLAGIGLAQNLAALKALVTDGIQKGHMQLQLKSLVLTAGATPEEIQPVLQQLQRYPAAEQNLATAQALLNQVRQKGAQ